MFMTSTGVHDINWEIQQVCHAIDYYERAYEMAMTQQEEKSFKSTIDNLNAQLKALERKRDEGTTR